MNNILLWLLTIILATGGVKLGWWLATITLNRRG